ncbi:hypothetical protein VNO77_07232 [Canavalia gladiata]|uniref:Uncharacterized protein n=1 Tax=Canavalia gladiata TaxID=3824 RepID=A0AAN9M7F7_CANGL
MLIRMKRDGDNVIWEFSVERLPNRKKTHLNHRFEFQNNETIVHVYSPGPRISSTTFTEFFHSSRDLSFLANAQIDSHL